MAMTLNPIMHAIRLTGLVTAKKKRNRIGSSRTTVHRGVRVSLPLVLIGSVMGCADDHMMIPDPAVRYLAFGDSGTSGSSGRSYPDILSELSGQPPEAIANQGRGGETTAEGLDRLRRLISLGIYPNAHTLLYWEGGADIIDLIGQVDGLLLFSPTASDYPHSTRLVETLDRIQTNIEAAVTEAQTAGLTVYVATYFSLPEAPAPCEPLALQVILPSQAQNANGYVSLLNERIRQAATNQGAIIVDIASADDLLQADRSNYLNCNHLSEKGNAIVAQLFVEALNW
jgi:lysophospholipase L1-like esterase